MPWNNLLIILTIKIRRSQCLFFFYIKHKSKSLVTNPADSTIKHFLAPKFVANKIINTFPLNFPPLGDFLSEFSKRFLFHISVLNKKEKKINKP